MYSITNIRNKVICGNSLDVLKEFPDECIDLIVTSPPYFGCRQYDEHNEKEIGRESDPLDYLDNIFSVFCETKRVLKQTGSLYLNMGDVYYGTKGFSRCTGKYVRRACKHYSEHNIVKPDGEYLQFKQLLFLPPRLAIMMQEEGWIMRNSLICEKSNPMPSFSPDRRLPVYEYMFHFVKSQKYYFDYEKAKEIRHHRDIVDFPIEKYKNHEASFSEKFVEPFILTTSVEGNLVLDPFLGSGTVAAVAKRLNRGYVGIDLVKENCAESEIRLSILDENLFAKL